MFLDLVYVMCALTRCTKSKPADATDESASDKKLRCEDN